MSSSSTTGAPAAVLARGDQRRVGVPEALGEHGVDGGDQRGAGRKLWANAIAAPSAATASARAEDLDFGVAEAVDRLEFVADGEEVVALQQFQQRELAAVGVLELVHHQQLQALRPREAHPLVPLQQIARAQLEVVEVERPARALELGVPAPNSSASRRAAHMRGAPQLQRVRSFGSAGAAIPLPLGNGSISNSAGCTG